MCEFCLQHGEGKVWYLQAANHSRELMIKLRTEEILRRHAVTFERSTVRLFSLYDRLEPLWRLVPPLRRLAHAWASRRQKKRHFGQVLPAEHAREVLGAARSIVRLPCTCRRFVKGKAADRYCLGLGFDPLKVYGDLPGWKGDFEVLTPRQGAALLDGFQQEEGLVHTVWTMPTPFVASICNCSLDACGAMLTTYKLGIGVIFPGELKAVVDPGLCRGCRTCFTACPFEALVWNGSPGKAIVLPSRCQGCGLCRYHCAVGAISLEGSGVSTAPPAAHHRAHHDQYRS